MSSWSIFLLAFIKQTNNKSWFAVLIIFWKGFVVFLKLTSYSHFYINHINLRAYFVKGRENMAQSNGKLEHSVKIPEIKFTKLFINGEFVDSISGSQIIITVFLSTNLYLSYHNRGGGDFCCLRVRTTSFSLIVMGRDRDYVTR